jgi:hypothetical protein
MIFIVTMDSGRIPADFIYQLTIIAIQLVQEETLKDWVVITTSGTSSWTFLKHVLYSGREKNNIKNEIKKIQN